MSLVTPPRQHLSTVTAGLSRAERLLELFAGLGDSDQEMLLTMVAPVAERLLALTSGAAATKTRRHVHLCAPSRRGRARKKAEKLLASAKLSEKDDAPARLSTRA